MILKFMQEKIIKTIGSDFFLLISCATIFLLSIFLRSTIDIGADTGIYISLGKKIFDGGKYYYDFFESNFPISFYLYALEYQLSSLLYISPIILSEIVINLLALLSIFWSAKILKNTTIYENKIHYNSLIIAYFLTFFLRQQALEIGEFGTKTSLLFIGLYPYISYSFTRRFEFTMRDMICRGCLMGFIPMIKPHYLVFIIFIEFYKFFQKKSLKFFVEIDKLIACGIGVIYLFLMLEFTPEFFEFMVPMWLKIYSAYDDSGVFFDNFLRHIASRISIFSFVFLIFSRLKFSENDKILAIFFAASSLLLILENIATVDQVVIFFAITTICAAKFLSDLLSSQKFLISENKFVITSVFLLPIFDLKILQPTIFGLGGVINIWWLLVFIYPFFLVQKFTKSAAQKALIKKLFYFLPFYFCFFVGAVIALKHLGGWAYIAISLPLLFVTLFFFERKIYSKLSNTFFSFSVFVISASISCLFYSYISSIVAVTRHDEGVSSPNKLTDSIAYYSKIYAPKKDDNIAMIAIKAYYHFPLVHYLQKENHQKPYSSFIQALSKRSGEKTMFTIDDLDRVFTISYFLDDIKNQIKNPNTKIIFVNNGSEDLDKKTVCLIGDLEYYFLDPEFKKIFLQNFHFENRVVINKKIKPSKNIRFLMGEKPSIFDGLKSPPTRVLHDFEVYVRNEKN